MAGEKRITEILQKSAAVPEAPASVNMDLMTADEIHAKLAKGYEDAMEGRVQDAKAVFDRFREKHS